MRRLMQRLSRMRTSWTLIDRCTPNFDSLQKAQGHWDLIGIGRDHGASETHLTFRFGRCYRALQGITIDCCHAKKDESGTTMPVSLQ